MKIEPRKHWRKVMWELRRKCFLLPNYNVVKTQFFNTLMDLMTFDEFETKHYIQQLVYGRLQFDILEIRYPKGQIDFRVSTGTKIDDEGFAVIRQPWNFSFIADPFRLYGGSGIDLFY